ncbi:MAG: DUF2612 domain-containing protein [Alcaligenes faecalis]|jgi:hypothetical protein|nr:DUF2612 domain-containing protein [Alcaligenes faecalis]
MNLEQGHADVAWKHFLDQYGGSSRLESLVRALYAPLEHHQLKALHDERWLDVAVGRQLDGIGQIVGQSREIENSVYVQFFGFVGQPATVGFDLARIRREHESETSGSSKFLDPEYRRILYWKIAVNNGHGTSPEMAAALKTIFDVSQVRIKDVGNAKLNIWISALPGPNNPLMADPYQWVPAAAGVGVHILTGSNDKPFGFTSQGFYGFGIGMLARVI